jgi:hypothetical protein
MGIIGLTLVYLWNCSGTALERLFETAPNPRRVSWWFLGLIITVLRKGNIPNLIYIYELWLSENKIK